MTDNSSDIAIPVDTLAFHSPIQNYTINFHKDTEVIGKLDFNGPKMVFTGNDDESVDAFVSAFGQWFDGRLKQERESEREACAKVCDEQSNFYWIAYKKGEPGTDLRANPFAEGAADCAEVCAAAIRARGET